jgi:hypothetical protein
MLKEVKNSVFGLLLREAIRRSTECGPSDKTTSQKIPQETAVNGNEDHDCFSER